MPSSYRDGVVERTSIRTVDLESMRGTAYLGGEERCGRGDATVWTAPHAPDDTSVKGPTMSISRISKSIGESATLKLNETADAPAARYIENIKLLEAGCPPEAVAAGPTRLMQAD